MTTDELSQGMGAALEAIAQTIEREQRGGRMTEVVVAELCGHMTTVTRLMIEALRGCANYSRALEARLQARERRFDSQN